MRSIEPSPLGSGFSLRLPRNDGALLLSAIVLTHLDVTSIQASPHTAAIVRAFQRRFEPHRVDGKLWAKTLEALEPLLEQREDEDC